MKLFKTLTCEFLGTAFLLATVIGSGILAHKIDMGNIALTVFMVAFATGCVLSALILMFGSISAHFNPVVTLVNAAQKTISWTEAILYIPVQIAGATFGVAMANLMFELPAVTLSQTARTGPGQWLGEIVATFGLIGVIQGCARWRADAVPFAVAGYVAGAILFTSSTCFANPAVTISRAFTDTITGIRLTDVPAFIVAQLIGAWSAFLFFGWLFGNNNKPTHIEATEEATTREIVISY